MKNKKSVKVEPPPIIEKLIRLVNLAKEKDYPDPDAIIRKVHPAKEENKIRIEKAVSAFRINSNALHANFPEIIRLIKEEIKSNPTLVEDICLILSDIEGSVFDPDDYFTQFLYYTDFVRMRVELYYIVAGKETFLAKSKNYDSLNSYLGSCRFRTSIFVDKDGKYKFYKDVLELALTDVDGDRLRICQHCRKFFWAYRKDKYGCSKKCGDSIRQNRKLKKNAESFLSRVERDSTQEIK